MSYSLRFTERMCGSFAFGETDYQTGYRRGSGPGPGLSGGALMFRLTIGTEDVSSFVADPTHAAPARGYVCSDVLGGRRPVDDGLFNLFVDESPGVRHMLYRLWFSDATGRPLTLAGYKDVRGGPLTKVWPETSTLYTRVLADHVAVGDGGESAGATPALVGSGVLRIRPADFAWQLTTFRVGGPTLAGRLRAFDAFGRLFLGELWQVFDPLRRDSHG